MKNLVKAVVSEIQTLENCHPDDVAFTNWGTNLEDDDSVSVSDLFPVIGMQEVEDLINMFMIYHPEESVYDSSSRSNKAVFIDFEKYIVAIGTVLVLISKTRTKFDTKIIYISDNPIQHIIYENEVLIILQYSHKYTRISIVGIDINNGEGALVGRLKLKNSEGVKFFHRAKRIFFMLQSGNIYCWEYETFPAADVTKLKLCFERNIGMRIYK